jgi:GNAT superfamily N-acetyltransferase
VGSYPFVLRLAVPGDLSDVVGLVREADDWLRSKGIDQWRKPWPDRAGHRERIRNDLFKGKTWLVHDGQTTVATITVDTDEPLDAEERCVWPTEESRRPALYIRRVIVRRRYAGLGLGAALMDWAADMAQRDHRAELIRIDAWTTNVQLHAYYERQRFTRCPDPQGLGDYPSQALFERSVDVPGSDLTKFFITEEGQARKLPHRQSAEAVTVRLFLPRFRTGRYGTTFSVDGVRRNQPAAAGLSR